MIVVKANPRIVERALLVGIQHPKMRVQEADSLIAELGSLVTNLGISVQHREIIRIRAPRARFLVGEGKAREIIRTARRHQSDCIIFDDDLRPAQQRNWEAESGLCVIDRREAILDIFADRAQTQEAALQVELARLEYSLPRLKRAWTHLGRQRGGGVTQRGEGEAQIEIDQRLVRHRIARLKRDLSKVIKRRAVQRKRRMRIPTPTAAIVGYTNAGKSSLLNRLTSSSVAVEDRLFSTLDPTTRRVVLPSGQTLLATDTVGFIRRLPHHLIDAFKATLEEAVVSDILIHVIDITSPEFEQHRQTTLRILKELGAGDKPMITIFNKIDLLSEDKLRSFRQLERNCSLYYSAKSGRGEDQVISALDDRLSHAIESVELLIPHHRYELVGRLHQFGCVKRETYHAQGVHVMGNIPKRIKSQFNPYLRLNGAPIHPPPDSYSR